MKFRLYCTPDERKCLERSMSLDAIDKQLNRVIVSSFKYGDLKKVKQDITYFRDEIRNAEYRINLYKKTGNTEYLIDAMNFLNFEYKEMKGGFIATDNDPNSKIIGG